MKNVIIIGGGVTGCAIARELSRYDAHITLIEREEDVCCGTSKANSAIVHAGFDAEPGSLKARFNLRGNEMMDDLARDLDIPFIRNGSLVLCAKGQDETVLGELLKRGEANNVKGLRIIGRDELTQMEPNAADDAIAALYAPTGGIICPFRLTISLAENAFLNGVDFIFNTEVTDIKKCDGGYEMTVFDREKGAYGKMTAGIVVNAAGVAADELNNKVSERKLHITARKGEYMLLDKDAGGYVRHTVFSLPTKMGKGVLVSPTVHGNLIVGPTALDTPDKESLNTTSRGLEEIASASAITVKNIPLKSVITSFAGLRAHEEGDDFIIGEAPDAKGFINAAGIESPGLTSAPAIGEHVARLIRDILNLREKSDFISTGKDISHAADLSYDEREKLIRENPAYGNIVCRCEGISEGEITEAIRRKPGAKSLDGVKRRTRAGMGRCQAGFCTPKVLAILKRETGRDIKNLTKSGIGSELIVGDIKNIR